MNFCFSLSSSVRPIGDLHRNLSFETCHHRCRFHDHAWPKGHYPKRSSPTIDRHHCLSIHRRTPTHGGENRRQSALHPVQSKRSSSDSSRSQIECHRRRSCYRINEFQHARSSTDLNSPRSVIKFWYAASLTVIFTRTNVSSILQKTVFDFELTQNNGFPRQLLPVAMISFARQNGSDLCSSIRNFLQLDEHKTFDK